MPNWEHRVQPNGKVMVRVITGYSEGKPIRVSKTFHNKVTNAEINQWISDGYPGVSPKVDGGRGLKSVSRHVSPDRIIDGWLENVEPTVAMTTFVGYQDTCRLYLKGRFPKGFTEMEVRKTLLGLRRQDGFPLMAGTMDKVRAVLKMVLAYAKKQGYISSVPDLPKLPRVGNRKDITPLSVKRYELLVEYLRGNGEIELETLLQSGLRVSELLGLRKKDLMSTGLYVRQTRTKSSGYRDIAPVKSERSRRTVALPGELMQRLRELEPTNDGFLFSIGQTGLTKRLGKACTACGLDVIGLHILRHSHCTYLLTKGANVVAVSARLGHHNPAFTLRRYAHLVPEMDKTILDSLESTGAGNKAGAG